MAKSTVKWFNGKKGYGFIVNPEGDEDIFVHFSNIVSEQRFKFLNQDAEVDFDLDKTGKGLQAKNVREISGFYHPEERPAYQNSGAKSLTYQALYR